MCSQTKQLMDLHLLQAIEKAEALKQEGNKLYADDELELAVVRPVPNHHPAQGLL